MNDTLMTVGAIFLAAVLMFIFPLMSTADRTDDVSQQVVKAKTQEFVDNIRSTGKITSDKYDSFVKAVGATGNITSNKYDNFVTAVGAPGIFYNVDMQVQVLDESASKKTTTAASTKVGENYYYKEYNDQIQSALGQSGVYRLKQGDMVSVEVKNTNKTISQVLKNFMYKVTGKGNSNISAQYSGIVNVNG